MATYLTINNKGQTVTNLTAMPVEIESWLRLSVIDYVSVGIAGDQPFFVMEEAGVTLKVMSQLQEKTPQYLVKIEILGYDLKTIARLHSAALDKIKGIAEKKPIFKIGFSS